MHPIRESTVMGIMIAIAQFFSFGMVNDFLFPGYAPDFDSGLENINERYNMSVYELKLLFSGFISNDVHKVEIKTFKCRVMKF